LTRYLIRFWLFSQWRGASGGLWDSGDFVSLSLGILISVGLALRFSSSIHIIIVFVI
jgi:hypothetical protein